MFHSEFWFSEFVTLMCWRCKLLKRSSDRSTDLWRRQHRQRSVVQWCRGAACWFLRVDSKIPVRSWRSSWSLWEVDLKSPNSEDCAAEGDDEMHVQTLQDPEQIMQELSSKTWYTNQPAKHGLDAWKELTRLTTASASLFQTGIWPNLHCKSVWYGFERPHSMAFWLLLDFARVGKI